MPARLFRYVEISHATVTWLFALPSALTNNRWGRWPMIFGAMRSRYSMSILATWRGMSNASSVPFFTSPAERAGFRRYWRWKSRSLGGRPQLDAGLRALIRQMSVDNPLWGAPRIHGELLKLGFEVAQSSVAKYMVKRSWP